jgi:hypothetical protein
MTEAQREALARGQAALAAKRAERRANPAGVVQTTSAEIREVQQARSAAPTRTIDDVVAKLAAADPELPPVEQVARETKLYTVGADPLPPPEDNPNLNDGIVASSEAVPDLVGIQPPRNLADLMSMVPTIGDGQYYVEVVRRSPQHYGGSICKGTQRPIKEYMTDQDFVSVYGGGDYTLTLYGPPPRGGTVDARTGRPRSKALSAPVKLEISTTVYPPNVQAAVLHDDDTHEGEETNMRYFQPGFSPGMPGRPPTTADARMLEVQLEHDEKMKDREEAREKALRAEQAGVSASLGPMLDVVHRNTLESTKVIERAAQERARLAEQQAQREEQARIRAEEKAEQEIREMRLQMERERNKPTDAAQMADSFTKMAAVLKPADSGTTAELAGAKAEARAAHQALDQARQEIQRLTQAHADEMQRAQKEHSESLRRTQDDHRGEMTRRQEQERNETERLLRQHQDELKRLEERLKENLERAERRASDAEHKAEQRVTDTEARAERRLGELREEHRRQIDDLRAQNQQRLDDERRQHDRDVKSQNATFETRLAGQRDMYDNRLTTMQGEVTRIGTEADRYRKEAEDNKDLGKHIERAQEAAAALGWGPSQGGDEGPPPPKDWKEMIGRIGMDLVQKLPDIVQSAGDTVTKLRGTPGPTPEQVQAMQYQAMEQSAQNSMARHLAGMSSAPLPPPMRTPTGAVFQAQPLRFGTEDASGPLDPHAPGPRAGFDQFAMPPPMQPAFQAPPYQAPPPQQTYQAAPPQQTYQAAPPQQTYQAPPQQYQQPVAAPPQPAVPQQTYQPGGGAAPQQTRQPTGSPQPASPAPPPASPATGMQAPPGAVPAIIPPDMIIQFAPVLEQALASGEPIENIAQELAGLLGPGNLAAVVTGLNPARVVVELQKAGKGSSSLVRRSGQQFLRELWAACGALLAQQG